MKLRYAILNTDKTLTFTDDCMTWARFFEDADRQQAETFFMGIRVSTVFLGLDLSHGDGKALYFETMIFNRFTGGHDYFCDRYETYTDAMYGHDTAVKMATTFKFWFKTMVIGTIKNFYDIHWRYPRLMKGLYQRTMERLKEKTDGVRRNTEKLGTQQNVPKIAGRFSLWRQKGKIS